jgi:PAS domain S-box-containing protein
MARLPAAIQAALERRRALKEITDYKYALDESAIVAITDQKGIIQYANENFCKISKYSLDELIGQDHRILNSRYHPADFIRDLWVTIGNGKSWRGEFRNRAKDGSIYWVDTYVVPFLNENGKPYQYLAIRQDITKRKKAEKELKQSELRLNEAQAVAHISNWEVDIAQNTHTWSDELYRIFGLNKGEVKPSTELFLSFLHQDDAPAAAELVTDALQHFTDSKIDFRFKLEDGKKRYGHIEWRFDFDESGKPFRIYGILQDITERKEAEESVKLLEKKMLVQKQLEQKKIARAVLKGQEKERNFIGQELHDNVNQILAGSKMYLSSAGKKDEKVKELIQYPLELIDLSIEEIRQLCYKLVTPQKNIKLNDLVQDLLYKLAEISTIQTSLTYTIPDDLIPDDLKLNIYRIIQELLNNTHKYAEAQKIEIVIIAKGGFIAIRVTDDGKGFNTKVKRMGIGISNIIYRAECFNGKVSIKSSPGKGCKATVKIPY